MSDLEAKKCPHCGKTLRADNTRGACTKCLKKPGLRPAQGKKPRAAGNEDSVLARMGFEVKRPADDEAPPATKAKAKKRSAPAPADPAHWQGRFRALTSALGLNPDGMLEGYCREWVETARARALTPPAPEPQKLLTAGEG